MKKLIVFAFLLSAPAIYGASLSTLRTGPVNAAKPIQAGNDSDRIIKCIAQNFTRRPTLVQSSTLDANGNSLQESTTTIPPGVTSVLHQVTGGDGYRYCTFAVTNKTQIKGWLEVADDNATTLLIEAR